jgi:hypothetical protein
MFISILLLFRIYMLGMTGNTNVRRFSSLTTMISLYNKTTKQKEYKFDDLNVWCYDDEYQTLKKQLASSSSSSSITSTITSVL